MTIGIDFDELQAMNEEIYAWVELPGADISHAVVQSATNDLFYNDHNIDKSYYSGGSIFSQRYNTKTFDDPVTVLYGHNRHSHTMFAPLNDFASEEGPERFADGQQITVAGVVVSSKTRTTKNNTLMAYVVVEDELASIELLCFSRAIEQCGSYMSVNTPVVVKGRLSVRDEKPPQIMCDTIYPLKTEVGTVLPQQESAGDDSVIYLRNGRLIRPDARKWEFPHL